MGFSKGGAVALYRASPDSSGTGGRRGAADDWTPVGPCREHVERLRRAGVDAKMHEFAGALHGFDVPASVSRPQHLVDARRGAPLSERRRA